MYLTIRTYAGGVGPPEEIARRVRGGVVPMLRGMPGFVAYYAAAAEGGGGGRVVFSVTVFDTRAQALDANERTRAWVTATMRDLLPEPPEVTGGEVTHHEAAEGAAGRDGYVAVRVFDGAGPRERVRDRVGAVKAPLHARQPGFRRFWALRSESHAARAVAVTIHEDAAAAAAAQARVLEAVAAEMGDLLPDAPTVLAGPVLVGEAA
jgi:heme-degrading monooxygenase HmoA